MAQDLWRPSLCGASGHGLTDVHAAVIPDFPYQPRVHVNYLETKLRIKDGLPKAKDVPTEMGGSGVMIAE